MSTIANYLVQLQKMTQTNLDILTAVNGALRGDSTSTKVEINGKNYDIPSFVSLENKVNALQETIKNIVNAPNTGEAFINMTGNSRILECRSYTHTPNSLMLEADETFGVENNHVFKDFLTPQPYVRFDLSSLPNDITSVSVKKIIPKTEAFKSLFTESTSQTAMYQWSYANMLRYIKTYSLVKDVDYIEYDTVKKLPIRKNIGNGEYIIKSIIKDEIDENLDNYITIQLANFANRLPSNQENTMTYVRFDGTLETYLVAGDRLVTYDDGAKMEIVEVDYNNLTMKVKVLYGEYLNLVGFEDYLSTDDLTDEEIEYNTLSDASKLKFFSPVKFDTDKYINIPLEEDDYIFIAIAPLNERMNVQSGWGTGVFVNTNLLTRVLDNGTTQKFKDYYKESVKNIGDLLYELTSMSSGELTKFSEGEFNTLQNLQPSSSLITCQVVQINRHINDSPMVENIRSLYNQKSKLQQELNEVQLQITEYNTKISQLSITDTTGTRNAYNSQLNNLKTQSNEISTALLNVISQISMAVNSQNIPSQSAKYHVRGYFDIAGFNTTLKNNNLISVVDKIRGIEVQYKYKNEYANDVLNKSSNISSIGEFEYSEWNVMNPVLREKVVTWDTASGYKFDFAADNSKSNEPSFNQIDIPIVQGEVVEMKVRVIYDYGYPYVKFYSPWTDIVEYAYPETANTEVQIKTIIEENNNDIETNRFNNILSTTGVNTHVGDEISDQELKYYHKAENIASGFYTDERRVIPLKDKLDSMNTQIAQLFDEVNGTNTSSLSVSITQGTVQNRLYPYSSNNIFVESYNSFADADKEGSYSKDGDVVTALLYLNIENNTSKTAKLYPLFPANSDLPLYELKHSKFDLSDYSTKDVVYKEIPYGDFNLDDGKYIQVTGTNKGEYYFNGVVAGSSPASDTSTGTPVATSYVYAIKGGDTPTLYNGNGEYVGVGGTHSIEIYPQPQLDMPDKLIGEGTPQFEKINRPSPEYQLNSNGKYVEVDPGAGQYYAGGAEYGGVTYAYNDSMTVQTSLQKANQFITFRLNDPWNGERYYSNIYDFTHNVMPQSDSYVNVGLNDRDEDGNRTFKGSMIYPYLPNKYFLQISNDSQYNYKLLAPGEKIQIPIIYEYNLALYVKDDNGEDLTEVQKTLSFDIRTSLYSEPINYTFNVISKRVNNPQDDLMLSNKKYTNKYKTLSV